MTSELLESYQIVEVLTLLLASRDLVRLEEDIRILFQNQLDEVGVCRVEKISAELASESQLSITQCKPRNVFEPATSMQAVP